jgi:hypothetical protein
LHPAPLQKTLTEKSRAKTRHKHKQIAQTLQSDASSEFPEPYKANKKNAHHINVPQAQLLRVLEAF